MDTDLFWVLARMREKCTVFFFVVGWDPTVRDTDLFGVLARMREKCTVFFVVGWDPTVMDEGLILF